MQECVNTTYKNDERGTKYGDKEDSWRGKFDKIKQNSTGRKGIDARSKGTARWPRLDDERGDKDTSRVSEGTYDSKCNLYECNVTTDCMNDIT